MVQLADLSAQVIAMLKLPGVSDCANGIWSRLPSGPWSSGRIAPDDVTIVPYARGAVCPRKNRKA